MKLLDIFERRKQSKARKRRRDCEFGMSRNNSIPKKPKINDVYLYFSGVIKVCLWNDVITFCLWSFDNLRKNEAKEKERGKQIII